MSDLNPECVFIGEAVLCQRIQDEAVLLNMDSQQYYGLNPTAAEMWNQLVELNNLEAAESRLVEIYGTDPIVLKADLAAFVNELIGSGLLTAERRSE